ncbi:Dehydrogenase, E1 component [Hesseltinella vesiculosa]|uniref:2-oxoisovalerate dehydrogenase subunit alpha n=1 Tax=Hesseltinella vesiculosa TaxID=101127 RepID=A0A1X2GWX2_9FUNG|nr:Dehydrogenase, E1 component [Hesseltinella vesiculosa]
MDKIMYEAQRQGRFSFYMTHFGEEALLGVVAALQPKDVIHGQYREAFGLLYRGFTVEECMDQCFANVADGGKGRQMPVHYTSSKHYFQSISSPLATQIPQAAGSAYALKMRIPTQYHANDSERNCSVCFFGEGAASEGDFHAGMNLAATLKCPVVFVCRNNGYAISTPASEQYNGDGIASRGVGYGMDTIRIDGNDMWAAYNATKTARKIAVEENKPVLIEAMTYRVGHHSTSDDSTKYRDRKEVERHQQFENPITRVCNYMMNQGFWTQAEDDQYKQEVRDHVMSSFKNSQKKKKPPVKELFTDVYDTLPPNLVQQEKELERLITTYPEYFDFLDEHEKS